MRTWTRRIGTLLVVAGAATLLWAVVVWQWQDPFTALYTMYQQHELTQAYDKRAPEFAGPPVVVKRAPVVRGLASTKAARAARAQALVAAEERTIRLDARRYRLASKEGAPLGRVIVPRLGLNMIFLNGTDESSLERGPGRDLQTFMPGEGRLVYIAGHRTTFLAPFSHIDALRAGDRITLELPYATFVYRVTHHIIVPASDLNVLRSGKQELLALQACHPRFFATHRYIVYADPVTVTPTAMPRQPYTPT
jgi:sortase A